LADCLQLGEWRQTANARVGTGLVLELYVVNELRVIGNWHDD
jgi:hypothetical protein